MLALYLSAVAGFLCTSIVLLLAKTARSRRSYGFWTWLFSASQLIIGVVLLTHVITPGTIHIIDTSSATTLREILGFLAGILARASLTFSTSQVLKPSSILLPNGTPAHISTEAPPLHYAHYLGPLLVIFTLLGAGAFAPYFDGWLKRLRSFDTPWASLTFAGPETKDRFDIEQDALTAAPVDLQILLTARQALRRDANISKAFPESQEAQFADTWAPTLLFFDRYLTPLSACLSLLHQQNRSERQIEEVLWTIPSSLERISVDAKILQKHANDKDIDQYIKYYDLSWKSFSVNLDRAVQQARDSLSLGFARAQRETGSDDDLCLKYNGLQHSAIRPQAELLPQQQSMAYDDILRVVQNPYFSMAISVLHASVGNMKEALNALESGAAVSNLNSPRLLLSLLRAKKRSGADFYELALRKAQEA